MIGGLKALARDYTRSLESIETEETLDLILYRPLAFFLAKLTHPACGKVARLLATR